ALVRDDRGCQARRQRARLRLLVAEDAPERALARKADEDGAAERDELREAPHELEVLLHRLAEADARIEDDVLLVDPGVDREAEALLEERGDVRHDVSEGGLPLPMHQADPRSGRRDEPGHAGVS